MNVAARDPEFGARLLIGGKSATFLGKRRETWLCVPIAAQFVRAGIRIGEEFPLPGGGRIDIAVLGPDSTIEAAVEVKFYYTHQCRKSGGHPYLCNTLWDFYKRARAGMARQQAILIVGRYLSMPPDGAANDLCQADQVLPLVDPACIVPDFDRFEADLLSTFSPICEVFPAHREQRASDVWQASFAGAVMDARVWVLELRSEVGADDLLERFRLATTESDYRKRLTKVDDRVTGGQ